MISTLRLFLWAYPETFTPKNRDALFQAAYTQLTILADKVTPSDSTSDALSSPLNDTDSTVLGSQYAYLASSIQASNINNDREVGLTVALLLDFVAACLATPGFTELQKYFLRQAAGDYSKAFQLHACSGFWPFQTIAPNPNAPEEEVRLWLEVFETGAAALTSQGQHTSHSEYVQFSVNKVGFHVAEWVIGQDEKLTFAQANQIETTAMMEIIDLGCQIYKESGRQIPTQSVQVQQQVSLPTLPTRSIFPDQYSFMPSHRRLKVVEDDGISPRASNAWDQSQLQLESHDGYAKFMNVSYPIPGSTDTRQKQLAQLTGFDVANAKEFVPLTAYKQAYDTLMNMPRVHTGIKVNTNDTPRTLSAYTQSPNTFASTFSVQQQFNRGQSLPISTATTTTANDSSPSVPDFSSYSTAQTTPSIDEGVRLPRNTITKSQTSPEFHPLSSMLEKLEMNAEDHDSVPHRGFSTPTPGFERSGSGRLLEGSSPLSPIDGSPEIIHMPTRHHTLPAIHFSSITSAAEPFSPDPIGTGTSTPSPAVPGRGNTERLLSIFRNNDTTLSAVPWRSISLSGPLRTPTDAQTLEEADKIGSSKLGQP